MLENIKITNNNITFEYGKFIPNLRIQLKKQTDKYILKDYSYLTEMGESIYTLNIENFITEEQAKELIYKLDKKVRNNLVDNPKILDYKYRTLKEVLGSKKDKNYNEQKKELINTISDLYYNKHYSQIEIARKLNIKPNTISFILHKNSSNFKEENKAKYDEYIEYMEQKYYKKD